LFLVVNIVSTDAMKALDRVHSPAVGELVAVSVSRPAASQIATYILAEESDFEYGRKKAERGWKSWRAYSETHRS